LLKDSPEKKFYVIKLAQLLMFTMLGGFIWKYNF